MIFIYSPHEAKAKILEEELTAQGMPAVACVAPEHFPDTTDFWNRVDLAIVDPQSGYASVPNEWKEETESGQFTGLVLMKYVVPLETGERSKIPVLLRSALYHGEATNDSKDGQSAYQHSVRLLQNSGFNKIYLEPRLSTATNTARFVNRIVSENGLMIRNGPAVSS